MTKKTFRGFYSNDGHRYEWVGPKPCDYKVDGHLTVLEENPFNLTPNDALRMAIECEPGCEDWRFYVSLALKKAPRSGRGRPKKNSPDEYDQLVLSVMRLFHHTTGETQPYSLAKAALNEVRDEDTYEMLLNNTTEDSTVERMARLWKKYAMGTAKK